MPTRSLIRKIDVGHQRNGRGTCGPATHTTQRAGARDRISSNPRMLHARTARRSRTHQGGSPLPTRLAACGKSNMATKRTRSLRRTEPAHAMHGEKAGRACGASTSGLSGTRSNLRHLTNSSFPWPNRSPRRRASVHSSSQRRKTCVNIPHGMC